MKVPHTIVCQEHQVRLWGMPLHYLVKYRVTSVLTLTKTELRLPVIVLIALLATTASRLLQQRMTRCFFVQQGTTAWARTQTLALMIMQTLLAQRVSTVQREQTFPSHVMLENTARAQDFLLPLVPAMKATHALIFYYNIMKWKVDIRVARRCA